MSDDQTFKKILMKELLTCWSWIWLFILWGVLSTVSYYSCV